MTRRPRRLSATISASSVGRDTRTIRKPGSAWAKLPQNVPRARIGRCAIWCITCGEEPAERAVLDRPVERRMAHAGTDAQAAVLDRETAQRLDAH